MSKIIEKAVHVQLCAYFEVMQRLGLLKRLKHLLPMHTRKIYVLTMIIPILEYANNVWGDKNNKVLMDSIQVLQNKAAKLILDEPPRSSSSEALSMLKWLDLSSRRQIQRCLFMFDMIHDSDESLIRGTSIHNYNTRMKDSIRKNKAKTKWGLMNSFNSALDDWNLLPLEFRSIKQKHCFKKAISNVFWTKNYGQ